ncbi:MAG: HAD-IA family hydrolase [Pseudomonadales bacterium]|nr:HAD-IA family hydrolase [Pseudomonadales bacterium]
MLFRFLGITRRYGHNPERLSGILRIMSKFDTVLFDWMLTLAHYPTESEHLALALKQLGRTEEPLFTAQTARRIRDARNHPDALLACAVEDTSREAHAYSEFLVYEKAGLDDELAETLYSMLGTPDFHRPYLDSQPVLRTLKDAGYAVGIVSDIHSDLRIHATTFGWADFIDSWSLSYEQGIQKPNLQMFQTAIDQLGCDPARTVMVGDRGAVDGAAAELGVACLILPAIDFDQPDLIRGLTLVLDFVGLS